MMQWYCYELADGPIQAVTHERHRLAMRSLVRLITFINLASILATLSINYITSAAYCRVRFQALSPHVLIIMCAQPCRIESLAKQCQLMYNNQDFLRYHGETPHWCTTIVSMALSPL